MCLNRKSHLTKVYIRNKKKQHPINTYRQKSKKQNNTCKGNDNNIPGGIGTELDFFLSSQMIRDGIIPLAIDLFRQ